MKKYLLAVALSLAASVTVKVSEREEVDNIPERTTAMLTFPPSSVGGTT